MINNPPGPHSIVLPFHKAPRLSLKENALSNALYAAFPEQAFGGETTLSIQSSMSDAALSEETRNIERYVINTMQHPRSPASLTSSVVQKPLEERLFDATANVKILTAQVSMHLEREWRDKLFRQLDSLHDPEEWEPDDEPIQQASFATFLKAIVQLKPQRRPGLGLSHGGNLIAAWSTGRDRLTIEFLPNDGVRWVISRYRDDESERFAGQTAVSRLAEGLAHYSPDNWLSA
jgi:hypothetical protein